MPDSAGLQEQIAQELQRRGEMSFAEFMSLALYTPGLGYYEQSRPIVGRRGDFYTSVSVGSLFGELLAFQMVQWLESFLPTGPLHLAECGAHNGQLALDILTHLQSYHPHLFSRVQLWLVEPSSTRKAWQKQTLQSHASQVHWAQDLDDLHQQTGGLRGVFYSNELLDAFPVHRVIWNRALGVWQELGVGLGSAGEFVWKPITSSLPAAEERIQHLNQLPRELLEVIPEGFLTEVAPAATAWWSQAAQVLKQGRLVTFDYGLASEEFLMPQRSQGTLRTYARHRPGGDPLSDPGQQDLTAHVHFSALDQAGVEAGLSTEGCESQRGWLTRVLGKTLRANGLFPEWDSRRVRQFQTLTHPEHLGQAFRVLVQVR